MFYGWLLAVLGYNLKADESVASQFCAHLYKSARRCGVNATDPAATHIEVDRLDVRSYNIDTETTKGAVK